MRETKCGKRKKEESEKDKRERKREERKNEKVTVALLPAQAIEEARNFVYDFHGVTELEFGVELGKEEVLNGAVQLLESLVQVYLQRGDVAGNSLAI